MPVPIAVPVTGVMTVVVTVTVSVVMRMACVLRIAWRGAFQGADYTGEAADASAGDKKERALRVFQHSGCDFAE
jgi:hypothetical protein